MGRAASRKRKPRGPKLKSLIPTTKVTDQYAKDLLAEIRRENLLAEVESLLQMVGPVVVTGPPSSPTQQKQRAKRPWQPTDRERAILNLPRKLSLEAHCVALDEASVPFPEKWQHRGQPRDHAAAWKLGKEPVWGFKTGFRDLMKSERTNVWNRAKRG
jgi:hypothetical protein